VRPSHRSTAIPSLALAAVASLAACESASSRTAAGDGDGPPVDMRYNLTLRTGTMVQLIPRWPFSGSAAWGLVRFQHEPALRGAGDTALAHMIWQDTTFGRVAPPGAPTSLQLDDSAGSEAIAVAGTEPVIGFAPPEPFIMALRGRDSLVATLGDIHLAGIMTREGDARGEWVRMGADGRPLARGRFELTSMGAEIRGIIRQTKEAVRPRPAPDTIAR
jgi:hypothetical protein